MKRYSILIIVVVMFIVPISVFAQIGPCGDSGCVPQNPADDGDSSGGGSCMHCVIMPMGLGVGCMGSSGGGAYSAPGGYQCMTAYKNGSYYCWVDYSLGSCYWQSDYYPTATTMKPGRVRMPFGDMAKGFADVMRAIGVPRATLAALANAAADACTDEDVYRIYWEQSQTIFGFKAKWGVAPMLGERLRARPNVPATAGAKS
jgi:hypothetical protein